jgi:Co/Zn/Cd efflux system component
MKYAILVGFYLAVVLCCASAFIFLGAAMMHFVASLSAPIMWIGVGVSGTVVGGLSMVIATNLAQEDNNNA